nr:cytochrome P450 83B1-like [Ipomoea trifida]
MTALLKDPRVMNLVQSEIRELVGKKGKVDEEDIQKLPYFKAVIKESLRLYPPSPILVNRESLSKCTIDSSKRNGKERTSLPGPPGLPIIGNLHQFDSAKPHVFLWKLSKKYGPLMRMKLGSREVVVISSARMAKEALKTHDLVFSSRPSFIGQQRLSHNGLDIAFAPYGEYWREIRKISVLHLFSLRRVKLFQPIREDEVSRMINRISELAFSSQLVNLSEIVMSLTCNITCRSAFGKSFDEERPGKWGCHKLLAESQAMMMGGSLIADFLPSFGWLDKLIGYAARLERVFKQQDSFHQQLIDQHLDPNRPKSMDGDMLDTLIRLKMEDSSSVNLTWDHIKAVLMKEEIDTNVLPGLTMHKKTPLCLIAKKV